LISGSDFGLMWIEMINLFTIIITILDISDLNNPNLCLFHQHQRLMMILIKPILWRGDSNNLFLMIIKFIIRYY
jgi:hypothetical protein